MNGRRVAVVLALAVLLVLAGCSGAQPGGGGGDGGDGARAGDGGSGGDAPEATSAGSGGGDGGDGANGNSAARGEQPTGSRSAGVAAGEALIRTGTVTVEVDDYAAARSNLTAAVRAQGGFVSDATQEIHRRGNRTWTTGTVVYRVPSENFAAFVERAKGVGEVQASTTETEDVTDQLVDIEARLTNLRNERDRLRTLYDEANTTEDVLAVREELAAVQEEIERLEARKRSLEDRVAYSTVRVTFEEPRPEPEVEEPDRSAWYDTPVTAAFLSSVDGVVVAGRALVVGLAYAAPYLLAFGAPVLALGYVVHRRL